MLDDGKIGAFRVSGFRRILQPAQEFTFKKAAQAALQAVITMPLRGANVREFRFEIANTLCLLPHVALEAGNFLAGLLKRGAYLRLLTFELRDCGFELVDLLDCAGSPLFPRRVQFEQRREIRLFERSSENDRDGRRLWRLGVTGARALRLD